MWNNIRQDNRNGLLGKDPSVDGSKTGHTDSAASASRPPPTVTACGCCRWSWCPSVRAREEASAALLNYGYTFYETVPSRQRADGVEAARLQVGDEFASVGVPYDLYATSPRAGRGAAHHCALERASR